MPILKLRLEGDLARCICNEKVTHSDSTQKERQLTFERA